MCHKFVLNPNYCLKMIEEEMRCKTMKEVKIKVILAARSPMTSCKVSGWPHEDPAQTDQKLRVYIMILAILRLIRSCFRGLSSINKRHASCFRIILFGRSSFLCLLKLIACGLSLCSLFCVFFTSNHVRKPQGSLLWLSTHFTISSISMTPCLFAKIPSSCSINLQVNIFLAPFSWCCKWGDQSSFDTAFFTSK